ncbi:MAG TPA: peptide-N4-asparagine amidase [Terriglobales bacterium]|nr:peptide-N4-asparagine amidase [Terriglobales bacterium]
MFRICPASLRPASLRPALRTLSRLAAVCLLVPFAFADGPYTIGSSNTVTADPTIPRPSTKPCVVTLFTNYSFDNNYNLNPFTYTPPEDCPGPWAKVVLEVDISVTAGIQYDRTANIWLGGANIFFGTTAEPSPTLAPSWHVESDLTDYSPLFTIAQNGSVYLGNTVNSTFTGIQSMTATLELYPLAHGQTAPVTANVVLPLSAGPTGGTVSLNTGSSTLAATFSLPTNIQNAYLDVYSQSQIDDEFWYTCVPNDVATELESCTNTAFRETEITIDGQPAGVAPVFPWIFTGGIDPWLWFPIPGVQTLNFTPYRVDLTPFAALLSNGEQHTISLSVYNADSWFSDTASLLLYLDSGSTTVTGALTKNTLTAAPNPVVTENLNVGASAITGTVKVTSARNYTLSGYVNTSHGKITTTISNNVNFTNNQSFIINNNEYVQNINQTSSADSTTTVATPGQSNVVYTKNFQFPLTLDLSQVFQSNGNLNQTTKVWQTYDEQQTTKQNGILLYTGLLTNAADHQDTLEFDSSFNVIGNIDQSASQLYNDTDSTGVNLYCTIAAAGNVLTSFAPTCSQ